MRKIIGFVGFALCLSSIFLSTVARAQTLYQVELIAFARSGADSEENWDKLYSLYYPERYARLQAADGSDAPFQLLAADAMQMNKEAAAIASRRNLRVLLHAAWRQPVDDPAHATAVIIDGGTQFGTHHELEGTFTLSIVEHFLRADADLWLSRFSNDAAAASGQILPSPPDAITAGVDVDASPQYAVTQTVVLQQRRRMRSGELHYFDHPRLGLLVLVTPVAPTTPATDQQ